MGLLEKIADERVRHTPATGFNLVGFDDEKPMGEMLFLVGHFDSREAAEQELQRRVREGTGRGLAIFAWDDF